MSPITDWILINKDLLKGVIVAAQIDKSSVKNWDKFGHKEEIGKESGQQGREVI